MVLKQARILFLLGFYTVSTAFSIFNDLIPPHHLKLIERRVQKHFDEQNVVIKYEQRQLDTSLYGEGCKIPICNTQDSILGYLCYRKANACNFGGCRDAKCDTLAEGFREHIYYFAILNHSDTIQKLMVLEYESTYGYEISSQSWLKQFYKVPKGNFELNSNIDGITGATVSVNAMINDLNSL